MLKIKTFLKICYESIQLLTRAEPLILSSSTAFFTTFSLSPILILLLNLYGLYSTSDKFSNQLFEKIGGSIGFEAAAEIEKIVHNFMGFETSLLITLVGLIFFIFVATTLLGVVKKNIHTLWHIRKSAKQIRYQFRERTILAGIILFTGALFVISFVIDSSLAISLDYLQSVIPKVGIIVIQFLNIVFSVVIVTVWFTVIFKMLPEAKVDWDVAFSGAFLTGILFNIGKLGLSKILVHARIATIFGASASFALLLLFIFYCSFILYFGAAFTYAYGAHAEQPIAASKYSHAYEETLIKRDLE